MSYPVDRRLDRRRSVRLRVASDGRLPAGVRDISLGGLSLVLEESIPIDAVRDFALTLGDGTEIVLRARAVYSRTEYTPEGRPLFVTGLEFLADVTDHASLQPLRLAS